LLAKRIETGLKRLQAQGDFDQMIEQNPLTKHVFPLQKWQGVNVFNITNPGLPNTDSTQQAQYWLNLGSEPSDKTNSQ
jgi:hypothetical protein